MQSVLQSQRLPISILDLIKSFIPDDIFMMRRICKKSRFIELQDIEVNTTLLKIKNLGVYEKIKHHNLRIGLDLSGTTVKDVSMLGSVYELDLSGTKVIDVSALGSVYKLNLADTDVADVSMLGDVHTLDLSFTKVTDASMLGAVHTLKLRGTEVIDVSMLGFAPLS
jgi:hypothetical protein